MNSSGSHKGDLRPLNSVSNSASYFSGAVTQPSLWTFSAAYNVYNKAMTIYEFGDDLGTGSTWASQWNGSAGKEIACCTIRRWKINWAAEAEADKETFKPNGRGLGALEEDVDVFTPEEFRELFGYAPDPEDSYDFLNN